MGHTPYGYRIENGSAVIDDAAADVIRQLYQNYLSGMALSTAAKAAGLETYHGTAKRLLQNMHYLGDAFYPAIIDRKTFEAAAVELQKRASKLGRLNRIPKVVVKQPPVRFTIQQPQKQLPNPYEQAEYLYSLIGLEVTSNGTR